MNEPDSQPSSPAAISQVVTQALQQQGLTPRVRVQGHHLHIGLTLSQIKHPPKAIAQIYLLMETMVGTDPTIAPITHVTVYGLASAKQVKWKETFAMPQPGPTRDDLDLLSFNNRYSNALTFPVVTVLALILNGFPLTAVLLRGIHIWIHEFGHATVAWMAGYNAIPLPFGWTNTGLNQSFLVYGGVLTLLGLLAWSGFREGRRWPMVLAIALALLQFIMTWILPDRTYRLLFYFGGVGGEFYLSTLLLVSFYFPLPAYWQWEFWRYPVAIAAAFTFWHIWGLWHQIERGVASIPWGTLWAGVGDANGDMNILSADYGWSDQHIINTYTSLGHICLLVLLGLYGAIVLRQNHHTIYGWWLRLLAQIP